MPSSHKSLLCRYRYDALDRLIGHTPINEAQHQRFYCKSRLATEIQGALRHSIVQSGELLLAQQQRSGNTFDTTLLATDQQRSVLHVVSEADQQQQPIVYSPYGHRCAESGLLSLLGFNGERTDPVTAHYLLGNGYRAFNPVLLRFNSPDSWSPFGKGGLNSYAYCGGDPINNSDPTGHMKPPLSPTFLALVKAAQKEDVASVAFARSLSAPLPLTGRILSESNSPPRLMINSTMQQPPSLVQASLRTIASNNLKNMTREVAPPISKRVNKLNLAEGQKIAARLLESEPDNTLFKLAATGQLEVDINFAEQLPTQSRLHSSLMDDIHAFMPPDGSVADIFRQIRFVSNRMNIVRQRHLDLRGRQINTSNGLR